MIESQAKIEHLPQVSVAECRHLPPCVRVLTQDVPDDALALGRSRQVVKQGWATRLRGLKALGKKKG